MQQFDMDEIGKTGDQRSVGYEWLKTETSNKAKEVVDGKSMNIKQIATEFCGNSGSIGEDSFAATDAYKDMCDLTALKTEFSDYIDSLET